MNLSIYCPFCHKYTSVEQLITSTRTYVGSSSNPITTSVSWYDSTNKVSWWMGKCNSCGGILLIQDDGKKIYPTPEPSPTDKSIPEIIRQDIIEAKLCFNVSAFNATVVMARRSIESICIDKGADKNDRLHQQINKMRNQGIITEELKSWATEVRFVGNDGAHPGDLVQKDDAEAILKLAEQFAEVIYVLPELAKELKAKREKK
jgi:hypothetical protein